MKRGTALLRRWGEKLKKHTPTLGILFVAMVVTVGGIALVFRSDFRRWPEFQPTDSLTPQVVCHYERDYGWRTGDLIPVEIFLKQQPGTVVDMHSLAVEGDFDIIGNPEIVTRDRKDGSRLILLRFKIQSLSVGKKLSLRMNMLWRDQSTGADKSISIPAFEPYTSPTWDGRDLIQDGSAAYDQGNHLWLNCAYLFGGAFGAGLFFYLSRRLKIAAVEAKSRAFQTRREIARGEFDRAWAAIASGDLNVEHYKSIARCLRKLFHIESKSLREIDFELGSGHPYRQQTLAILGLCGRVMYQKKALSRGEHLALKEAFDQIAPPPEQAAG